MNIDIWIPLRKDGEVVAWTVIDSRDKHLASYRWQLRDGYAKRTGYLRGRGKVCVQLHREILGLCYGDPMQCDHKDRNRLNNRRSNLRIVTHAQNRQNRAAVKGTASKYRGVQKAGEAWKAVVVINKKHHNIGIFLKEEDAAQAAKEHRLRHMTHSGDTK